KSLHEETAHECENEAVRRHTRPFRWIRRNYAQECIVRHVVHRIEDDQAAVGRISPDQFTAVATVRSPECEDGQNAERDCSPEYPRAKLPPTGSGSVRDETHSKVGDAIPESTD